MPYGFFYFDPLYVILVLPAVILALWAQWNVNHTFQKYSRVPTHPGMTGKEAARLVLDRNGLHHVQIELVNGKLSDHFDPRNNVIRLSDEVYHGGNAAAIGVAAHEAGHAVQYDEGYVPMKIRSAIIPATNIGSNLSLPLILLGIVFGVPALAYAGVIAFSLSTLFQLITLPVEFNASRRAMTAIRECGRFGEEEAGAARKVLSAAAMTYLAALAVSLANLLRLVVIASGSRRRD
ncbi:MAG: zinc metallopeptidase [Clostridia bacterium]|nr:zinc metallopeptidase [Clostridia bacterium]